MFLPRLCALAFAALLPFSSPARAENVPTLSYDARLVGYAHAFDVKVCALSSPGESLEKVRIHPHGEPGKPVVKLLHGKNFNAVFRASTARHLRKQGCGVLIPVRIGFGKSPKPVDYPYSFPALARHTRALIASLGIERSIVVGHSMGTMPASRFALMYPQAVQRRLLVNPNGLENYLKYVEHKGADFFYGIERKQTAESVANDQRTTTTTASGPSATLRSAVS